MKFDLQIAAEAMVTLGKMAMDFGKVDRITYHADGTPESDTDHTVMLGLVACAFAHTYIPKLDVGLVAVYSLVHDLVEVYAGDTPTLRMLSPDQRYGKLAREKEALERIREETHNPFRGVADTIDSYNMQLDPEARFVNAMDKVCPKITHLINGARTLHQYGVTREEYERRITLQIRKYTDEFPELAHLHAFLLEKVLPSLPPESGT